MLGLLQVLLDAAGVEAEGAPHSRRQRRHGLLHTRAQLGDVHRIEGEGAALTILLQVRFGAHPMAVVGIIAADPAPSGPDPAFRRGRRPVLAPVLHVQVAGDGSAGREAHQHLAHVAGLVPLHPKLPLVRLVIQVRPEQPGGVGLYLVDLQVVLGALPPAQVAKRGHVYQLPHQSSDFRTRHICLLTSPSV